MPPLGARAAQLSRFSASPHSVASTGISATARGGAEFQGGGSRAAIVVVAPAVVGGAAMVVAAAAVVVGGVGLLQARTTMKRKGPIQPDFFIWSL
jgi:hypothetical protein